MGLLEVTVDNLARRAATDQQADRVPSEMCWPPKFPTALLADPPAEYPCRQTSDCPVYPRSWQSVTFAGICAVGELRAAHRRQVPIYSGGTKGAMIGVTGAVVTDLTGGEPMIVQVRRV